MRDILKTTRLVSNNGKPRQRYKTIKGYMCATSYEEELGRDPGGIEIYPTMEDALTRRQCANDCGVIEVEIRFSRWVKKSKWND